MLALNNQDISFTAVPQLDFMGKGVTFIVVKLQPSQGALNFFDYVRAELIKAGIAHVDYPTFDAHISLGKITTPGITQNELAEIAQQGTDDLGKIPAHQLQFTVSSCMVTQNLTKPPVVSFEFQQPIRAVPVVAANVANKKQAAVVNKAVQKVAPRAVAPRVVAPRAVAPRAKVAAKNVPKRPVVKRQPPVKPQPKAVQKVAVPAKVVAKNAPKRPMVKQQPPVKKAVQKVAPRAVAQRAVAPQAKVVAKNAPKRPVVKKPLKR